jgi:uncharacterized protein (DUF305 family)
MRFILPAMAALAFVACSAEPSASTVDVETTTNELIPEDVKLEGVAPPHLVVDGAYSDVRFTEMMAPHHQHAIDMANVLLADGSDPELRALAQTMIQTQTKEIEELGAIKADLTGSSDLPRSMNPHTVENSGVPMPSELTQGTSVDLAFLDGMLPHHSGAIQMATVALRHTRDARIAHLARTIIDGQAREIGEMERIRSSRYSGVNHGFPHAD